MMWAQLKKKKMAEQEDPEFTSIHKHIKYITTYRETLAVEGVEAAERLMVTNAVKRERKGV